LESVPDGDTQGMRRARYHRCLGGGLITCGVVALVAAGAASALPGPVAIPPATEVVEDVAAQAETVVQGVTPPVQDAVAPVQEVVAPVQEAVAPVQGAVAPVQGAGGPSGRPAAPAAGGPSSPTAAPVGSAPARNARGATGTGGGTRPSAAAGSPGATTARSGAARPTRRERARDHRLRDAVLGRRVCLGSLPRIERRVLILRAGLRRGAPRRRVTVARMIDRPVARVRRLERRALKRLKRLSADGSCGGSAAVATGAPTYPAAGVPAAPPEAAERVRQQVGGEHASGQEKRHNAAIEQRLGVAIPSLRTKDGGLDLTPFIAVGGFLAVIALGIRNIRRDWEEFP
jgi:hypothetical protein